MDCHEIMKNIKQELINQTMWVKKLEISNDEKDKMKMLNLIIEKYNCEFDEALKVVEYFIDKKPLPLNLSQEEIAYRTQKTQDWQNKPKCITCGSTNIKKISTTAKVAGAVAFGLFSKTAKSQFKCENCGCKW